MWIIVAAVLIAAIIVAIVLVQHRWRRHRRLTAGVDVFKA
jgi:hypothetical protein